MDLNVVVPTSPESFAFVALRKGHLSGAEQFLDNSMFNDRRLTEICLLLLELRLRAKLEVTRLRPDENDTSAGQDGVATCLQCDRNHRWQGRAMLTEQASRR